ncbi:MAG: MFS transporter [Sedimentisphaerales bacterium]|nr:MFS transporter [Sedimentisphaerales bacterium]
MNKKIATFYWMQLFVLAGVHCLADLFANMLPAILPAIRDEFSLSLSQSGHVVVAMLLTCNAVQPLVGHMRARKRRPLFLHLGLIVAASICLLNVLPRADNTYPMMIMLAIFSGLGVAVVHPEGLRAVHCLGRIQPAVSTAVFMAGGFLGYAGGGALSAFLVSRYGLKGLYPLVFCPVVGVVLVMFLKIRLAVERRGNDDNQTRIQETGLSFWLIITMALPAAVSTTILTSLLPTMLNELGFKLTFGGVSTTMFGLGGAVGSFVFAHIAGKKGELKCSIVSLFLVIPFMVAYLVLIENKMAIWLLFGAGFCSMSAYILMITLSRRAAGLNLGHRMGFMVGGTWAFAFIVFSVLLPVAERFGTDMLLRFVPLGYLFSALIGLYIMFKRKKRPDMELPAQ